MSVLAALNSANPNNLADAAAATQLGSLLAFLISKCSDTESGVTVTSNAATIAAQPVALLQVKGITAGAVHTVKKIRKGPVSGDHALVPASGEVIWDGGTKLLFCAADLATTCDLVYTVATDTASITQSDLSAGAGA